MELILLVFIVIIILIAYRINIKVCLIYNIFHIPCIGCGLTRSVISLLKGNLMESLKYNPLPIIILIIIAIMFIWIILDCIRKKGTLKKFLEKYRKGIIIVSVILAIIIWIININNPLLY